MCLCAIDNFRKSTFNDFSRFCPALTELFSVKKIAFLIHLFAYLSFDGVAGYTVIWV